MRSDENFFSATFIHFGFGPLNSAEKSTKPVQIKTNYWYIFFKTDMLLLQTNYTSGNNYNNSY